MSTRDNRSAVKLIPLAALMLACGLAQAASPPKVMFVSGKDAKPVLVDLAGKEIPAKKGQVIPPGFSVKVPEGATVQIMTEEKAIVAIRQGSLLRLEALGDGDKPHRFKLDNGGLRIANSDKKPHKFEVDTPNAKIRFDKGDHEAFYLKDGNKITGEKWGTFVRGFKDESILTTKDGDTKIDRSVIGYVSGASLTGKTELIDRVKVGGSLSDPVTNIFTGSKGTIAKDLGDNQKTLADKGTSPVDAPSLLAPLGASLALKDPIITPKPTLATAPVLQDRLAPSLLDTLKGTSPVETAGIKPAAFVPPKDLIVDPDTKIVVLIEKDQVSLPPTKQADLTKVQKINIAEIPKTVVAPPPPPGTTLTKEQAAAQISTGLKNTNILNKIRK
ncbi:MAG TPA: hypothetical protein VHA15_03705 [Burkholderiales bacterium]|jgi:hypothetical protein|nr:hypothetical protein [Burkholderiales bacterium]